MQNQSSVIMLDEHFRSKPQLIGFSNQNYYQGRLKIMQSLPEREDAVHQEFRLVDGTRNRKGINQIEVDHTLDLIIQHIEEYKDALIKPSIGALSPYREQAEAIQKRIMDSFSLSVINDFKIRSSTPYGFQGDERDTIIISFSVDAEARRAYAYLNQPDMFNVLITRARERQIIFHSVKQSDLKADNQLARFLNYRSAPSKVENSRSNKIEFLDEVAKVLSSQGIRIWKNYLIVGEHLDIFCQLNSNYLAIDLVGNNQSEQDYIQLSAYKVLMRAGIKVMSISYSLWKMDRDLCLKHIQEMLGGQAQ